MTTSTMSKQWRFIPCKLSELRLDITLACGQSFRWKEIQPGTWRSVLSGRIWTLKQTDSHILYQVHNPTEHDPRGRRDQSGDHTSQSRLGLKVKGPSQGRKRKDAVEGGTGSKKRQKLQAAGDGEPLVVNQGPGGRPSEDEYNDTLLQDYFQLGVDLGELYKQWKKADDNFTKVSEGFPGVRILRQDPVENLISFICSSNNNISRITGMVEKLCQHYGNKVAVIDGIPWHSFPSLSALGAKGVEETLRELGFGYRAKFINQTAKMVIKEYGGEDWLWKLRSLPYHESHSELIKLPGVGAKVADCVCLMSLDKREAIPVDTHVWQIASRDYMTSLQKTKSLTDRTYREIGDFFRELFGEYAGWAHSVLFSADLKKFQENSRTAKKAKETDVKKQTTSKSKTGKAPADGKKKKTQVR